MGPEGCENDTPKLYMIVDGEPVEVKPNLQEINCIEGPESDEDTETAEIDWNGILEAGTTISAVARTTLEKIIEEIMNAVRSIGKWMQEALGQHITEREEPEKRKPLDITTRRGKKEARARRQAVEQANAARFKQYNARETVRAVKKRTGPRGREWKGADRT